MRGVSPLRFLGRTVIPALLLAAAAGCSSGRDDVMIFDPVTGHPERWIDEHGDAATRADGRCEQCHGSDLTGGISQVSCFSSSYGGQGCHPGGPGIVHSAGWRKAHTSTPAGEASQCAPCHRSAPGTPGCFNSTLCHGSDDEGDEGESDEAGESGDD